MAFMAGIVSIRVPAHRDRLDVTWMPAPGLWETFFETLKHTITLTFVDTYNYMQYLTLTYLRMYVCGRHNR